MTLPPDPNVVLTPLIGNEVVNLEGGGELDILNKFTTTQAIADLGATAIADFYVYGRVFT